MLLFVEDSFLTGAKVPLLTKVTQLTREMRGRERAAVAHEFIE